MDSRVSAEAEPPPAGTPEETHGAGHRAVFFAKVENPAHEALDAEEFEIEIGTWRARIVRQADARAGRPRLRTRLYPDEGPGREKAWDRRRMQRLADRLNARRRP